MYFIVFHQKWAIYVAFMFLIISDHCLHGVQLGCKSICNIITVKNLTLTSQPINGHSSWNFLGRCLLWEHCSSRNGSGSRLSFAWRPGASSRRVSMWWHAGSFPWPFSGHDGGSVFRLTLSCHFPSGFSNCQLMRYKFYFSILMLLAALCIWTASSEFGTYRLCEQRRFRRACASAQSRQNLRCSLIQAVCQEEPSDRKPDPWPLWMAGHAQLKFVMTECLKTQIRLTGLNYNFQDQDQDSLLVKRRNDNHSPGPVIRELVPSSHQRSELSNTILCIFSGWDQRIGEGIPIPDSLGEDGWMS